MQNFLHLEKLAEDFQGELPSHLGKSLWYICDIYFHEYLRIWLGSLNKSNPRDQIWLSFAQVKNLDYSSDANQQSSGWRPWHSFPCNPRSALQSCSKGPLMALNLLTAKDHLIHYWTVNTCSGITPQISQLHIAGSSISILQAGSKSDPASIFFKALYSPWVYMFSVTGNPSETW